MNIDRLIQEANTVQTLTFEERCAIWRDTDWDANQRALVRLSGEVAKLKENNDNLDRVNAELWLRQVVSGTLTIGNYIRRVVELHKEMRPGQAAFYAVENIFPEISLDLTASGVDCYYHDDRVEAFIEEVQRRI